MNPLRLACLALAASTLVHAQEPRLANLSTRALAGTGDTVLTAGFVISAGSGSKQVLVRAVGPTLGTSFGLTGVLADPVLTIFGPDSQTLVAASNNDWGTGGATAATAATFSSVGAFGLAAGSRDAAILATLAPGSYTAQVTGANNTAGLALVEVYEVGNAGAKLVNISTRAQVATGANVMIPGVVISSGSGRRRLLVRAAGPALAAFGVGGTLADPLITLTNEAGATVATNNDWGTPVGAGAVSATVLTSTFTQAGAFPFAAGSRDAALIVDLGAGNYGIQVSGASNSSGLALVEVYDITPAGAATVTLRATRTSANETGTLAGEFTFTRDGPTLLPLTVNYGVSGSATNGVDYPALLGTVTIPAGATSTTIAVQPLADTTVETTETVTLTLIEGTNYVFGGANSGTVAIADNPGTLFVATLRPASGATGSAASGLATIVLSASGTLATVNVSFSNLSSGEVGAHLFIGDSNSPGDYVMNLPLGQVSGAQWNIGPTANYTSAQIIDALRSGRVYVGLDSAQFPAGELRGAFLSAVGSQNFSAPSAPPPVPATGITATDAARLLTQTTFGPRQSEIDALTGGNIHAWIDAQLAVAPTLHRPVELAEWNAEKAEAAARGLDPADVQNALAYRRRAWHQVVLSAPDQLRQRVAFALSQILVVGDDPFGNGQTEGLTHYYDTLVEGAFGNYRTLLENVTLHPIMGIYLSSLRNAKADPVTGTYPDENYAREVMQLFSIGLVLLQPDGTLKLDEQGLPIPTYTNTTITEMAKVFTGWGYANANPTTANFRTTRANYIAPMTMYSGHHDTSQKNIVNGVVLPAGLTGAQDLRRALDALFEHPNCPPFVCRQLIQRLVTDNPSPAYVYRVAQKFVDNGAGVRGDLAAVVRAILTDYEARSPAVIDDPGYGKLKEPLLRLTALLRGFNATTASGRNELQSVYAALNQGPLESPTVFNFFEPGYVYPGPLAAAGLVAPEFQITNDTTAITVPNYLRDTIFRNTNAAGTNYVLDLSTEQTLLNDSAALIDRIGFVLAAGQLTTATRAHITTALAALPAGTTPLERARTAVLLVATSLDGATQR